MTPGLAISDAALADGQRFPLGRPRRRPVLPGEALARPSPRRVIATKP